MNMKKQKGLYCLIKTLMSNIRLKLSKRLAVTLLENPDFDDDFWISILIML